MVSGVLSVPLLVAAAAVSISVIRSARGRARLGTRCGRYRANPRARARGGDRSSRVSCCCERFVVPPWFRRWELAMVGVALRPESLLGTAERGGGRAEWFAFSQKRHASAVTANLSPELFPSAPRRPFTSVGTNKGIESPRQDNGTRKLGDL